MKSTKQFLLGGMLVATVMAVTLEGQQEGTSTPRGGLGPALQPAGCSQAADQLTLVGVTDEPFVLAPSLAREILMKQMHGNFS